MKNDINAQICNMHYIIGSFGCNYQVTVIFHHYCVAFVCVTCFAGNYVLNYLASRPKLLNYVTQALVQVGYQNAVMHLYFFFVESQSVLSVSFSSVNVLAVFFDI